ncbi:AMP-binding protein [Streptomyces sp. SL13]|uniref:AMP-binding protein n=1 Tax=Streptantibioticus silvisoli TaxID=2705255 RepID=A0AA90H0I9_9ACTN|nr:AMP-binding protein [Streptantibioticus silvisoli]MDI5961247.1 AMP-binding protein [Streptantibioticus silvisoli]MDI5971049.1 AMP-binding protein [Streptantibioticus silvisoli]
MDNPSDSVANYVINALQRFAEYGDREAIVSATRRTTYADLVQEIRALVTELRLHGVVPESVVAILTGNQAEAMSLQFAAHLIGCRTVWVAGYMPSREQPDYLRRSGADYLVYDTKRYGDTAAELLRGDWKGTVLCVGPGGEGPDLFAGRDAAEPDLTPGPAPSSLFYTGGTTGRAKLVHHEHRFYLALLAIGSAWLASGAPTLKHLTINGFSHVSGHMTNLLMLFTGSTVVLHAGFDIPEWLAAIEAERATSTLLTPVQLYQVLDHPALESADLSSLLLLNVGGAAVSPTRLRQAGERLGPVIRLVYGLTEAAFVTEYRAVMPDPRHPRRLSSCGTLFADSRAQIRDADGRVLAAGETGEVWVSGSLVMSGYWDEPQEDSPVKDGWLHTGDIGSVDEDGYLYLFDRSKDMIVTGRGAVNVYSKPVEDVLTSHPGVRAAAVVGVPDEALGEAVVAFVVPAPGAEPTADELRELVTAELREYSAPGAVEFVTALPLTGMGKVDKKALRQQWAARTGAGTGR